MFANRYVCTYVRMYVGTFCICCRPHSMRAYEDILSILPLDYAFLSCILSLSLSSWAVQDIPRKHSMEELVVDKGCRAPSIG